MGTYKVTTLTARKNLPFYYRCTKCNALNVGLFPVSSSSSYNDRNAGFRRSTIQANLNERHQNAVMTANTGLEAQTSKVIRETRQNGWYGSADAPGTCVGCKTKQVWNRKHSLESGLLTACVIAGVITVVSVGINIKNTNWVIAGILFLITIGLFIGNRIVKNRYIAENDRVPVQNRPHVFANLEEFSTGLREVYEKGEPVYETTRGLAAAALAIDQGKGNGGGLKPSTVEAPPKKPGSTPAAAQPARKESDFVWKMEGSDKVICPRCGQKRPISYVRVNEKCPVCGLAFTDPS